MPPFMMGQMASAGVAQCGQAVMSRPVDSALERSHRLVPGTSR